MVNFNRIESGATIVLKLVNYIGACTIISFCALLFSFKNDPIKISTKDFESAFGKWNGSLSYLDYRSGKPCTMPANVSIYINSINNNQIIFSYQYPNEPKANGNDTLELKDNGTRIDNAIVIVKRVNPDGSLKIETERDGIDGNGNKKALLKHIYIISNKVFISRKEVKFIYDLNWIKRNEYSFAR